MSLPKGETIMDSSINFSLRNGLNFLKAYDENKNIGSLATARTCFRQILLSDSKNSEALNALKQVKSRYRAFQREKTRELATLDLIKNGNDQLRKLLRIANISKDVYHFVMDIMSLKDKELIRLRRQVLHMQDALASNKRNLLPRLVSKAAQVKQLKQQIEQLELEIEASEEETEEASKNNHHPRGKIALQKVDG